MPGYSEDFDIFLNVFDYFLSEIMIPVFIFTDFFLGFPMLSDEHVSFFNQLFTDPILGFLFEVINKLVESTPV